MLPDRVCRLLTAYVDGELSPRQRKAVLRLVRRSGRVRRFLRDLQHDAGALRSLPRQQLPPEFASQVLQSLGPWEPLPAPRPLRPSPRPVPLWAGLATAAAVLLLISTASYFYFASSDDFGAGRTTVAGNGTNERPRVVSPRATPPAAATAPDLERLPAEPDRPAAPVEVARADGKPPESDDRKPGETNPADVLTSPTPTMEIFKEVGDPKLALIFKVHDLDQDKVRQKLQEELQKDEAYRVELGCLESSRAFERLQAAFRAHGIRLVIDQDAQERLRRRLNTNYVLYAENVTADEVGKVLQQLSQDDKKAEAKRRGDGQFEHAVVNPMLAADRQELSKLLGVDAKQLQPERSQGPSGLDLRKPLSEKTADEVVRALKGQGVPRPEPGKPLARGPERLALVLAYNPVRPRPALSREVKQFLDSRKEPKAGTLQMLLVLRGARG